MKKIDLDRIKGDFSIHTNGDYVVLSGSKLHILTPDGNLVASRADLRNARKITFLSGNRMLLATGKGMFHMIDLRDGTDLWTAPYSKTNLNLDVLAISPDEAFAYTYDEWNSHYFIARLSLHTHDVDIRDFGPEVGASVGIACDEAGVPCILKTLTETIGGKTVRQGGVRLHDYDSIDPSGTTCWKTKWSFDDGRGTLRFYDGPDRILTTSLHVYEPATGASFDLLENETLRQRPDQCPSDTRWDHSGRYLSVKHQTVDLIIDTHTRTIAAQYAAPYLRGCLVGDEYWICIDKKICRKPFPTFEEAPPVKTTFNMDWYYSKRPELW